MLDSAIRLNKKYYPQTFLEECNYEINYLEPSSSDIDKNFF